MQILANAKINLTLDITGKRADGYHLLRMVMQSVSLCDRLTLTAGKAGIKISCTQPYVPCDERNTVYKAADAFFAYVGKTPDVEIVLEKRIPSQAGLGGGSSDAAAVLHALNLLYRTEYSNDVLRQIGLRVGADVPFCLLGGTALAEGIGEKLTALPSMPPCSLVICKPPVGVNTKRAYAAADSLRTAGNSTEPMLHALREGKLSKIAAALGNDFEQILHLQETEHIQKIMRSCGALGACMTGSGSAVYGIFRDEAEASECKERLAQKFSQVFLCKPAAAPFQII